MSDAHARFEAFKKYHETKDLVEDLIADFYRSFLNDQGTAIDCGSNKGAHAIPLARCCREVLAIDANREMCDFLSDQLRGLGLTNCKVFHAALQDKRSVREVTFYLSDNYHGRSSLTRLWDVIDKKVKYHPVACPAQTLDELAEIHALQRVDFIKLDLEGGEYKALLGGHSLLQRDMPVLVMENSIYAASQGGFAPQDPYSYLESLGYVLVAPNTDFVTKANLFPFWYLFALPRSKLDTYRSKLAEKYERICAAHGI